LRFTGLVYRAHNPRWAFAPDSGAGAARHGGRFNRVGMPALYTSLRLETAWLEAQQAFAFKAQPMTMCAYRVDCAEIVDLTDPATLEASGINTADLACAWEDLADRRQTPPTWAIADRLTAARSAGILVPGFAAGATREDVNAVFWRWSPSPPHQLSVVDDLGRLPKSPASWR
jgi:RES domain-containing protein